MKQSTAPSARKIGEITVDVLEVGQNRDAPLRTPENNAEKQDHDLFTVTVVDQRILLICSEQPHPRAFAVSIERLATLAVELIVTDPGNDPDAREMPQRTWGKAALSANYAGGVTPAKPSSAD